MAELLVVAAMFVFAVVTYATPSLAFGGLGIALLAVVAYGLVVYLYYGIARLAYMRRTYLLWGSALGAVILSYMVSGLTEVWLVLTGWGMVLFGGVIVGRLCAGGRSWSAIYPYGLAAVAVFAMAQYSPLWTELAAMTTEGTELMLEELKVNLLAAGYTAEAISQSLIQTKKMVGVMIRLLPAATIMAAIAQFSLGFIIFSRWAARRSDDVAPLAPLSDWKMPFWLLPALILIILVRMMAEEPWIQVADNLLAALSLFYCLTGMSLVEHFLVSLKISRFMKVLFYILLFFTQLAGFFVAVLLGFLDSFFDWRKLHTPAAVQ